ncbi:MAG: branched-chain amino acid ABC transporter permease [Aquabacterium sp.]
MRWMPEHVPVSSPRFITTVAVLLLFALVPVVAAWLNQPFYLTQFGRIMIYAIAACSLNLLIGYTGLVSFGHALYLALGAYAVSIPAFHGLGNGWLHLLAALAGAAAVAALTGLVVLRTSGMGFIMITLAFAQMFFFLGVSLKHYGGDDGMKLAAHSQLAPLDLNVATQQYLLIFGVLLLVLYGSWRLVHARLGYLLRGIKANERRMKALGFHTLGYKLAIYVIASCLTAVAGFLLANLTLYASPSYTAWTVSGELIVIVILGGVGTVIGPLVGALAFLLLEEWLSGLTQHWMAPLGIIIVLVVLLAKNGLYGSLHAWAVRRERGEGPP